MSVFLAYRHCDPLDPVELDRAIGRVQRWYEAAGQIDVDRSGDRSSGLIRWSTPGAIGWWEWTQDPNGARALPFPPMLPGSSGTHDEIKSQALKSIHECLPPFVALSHDARSGRITAATDILGLGKIYWAQTSRGIYFSNQPVALLLFSGTEPELDEIGWMHKASVGWFMENTTAYRGVYVMPPAAAWDVHDGRAIEKRSAPSLLSSGNPNSAVDHTKFALKQTVESVVCVVSDPTISLSGGRDSRLVVAAYLGAGLNFSCTTNDRVSGEVEVAKNLMELLPTPVRHQVQPLAQYRVDPGDVSLLERALNWHNWSEGTRSEGYLWSRAPSPRLVAGVPRVVGGAGGDVAHGFYYGPSSQNLILAGTDVTSETLRKKLMRKLFRPRVDVSKEVKAGSRATVKETLMRAEAEGISGFSLWDYFYLYERVRRWSGAAEPLSISPLHTPVFMRHALRMKPTQRVNNSLHNELINGMVPAWKGVPFFHEMSKGSTSVLRTAQVRDRDQISEIIQQDPTWRLFYDDSEIRKSWQASLTDSSSGRDERRLRQVIWLAGFQMHLEEVRHTLRS